MNVVELFLSCACTCASGMLKRPSEGACSFFLGFVNLLLLIFSRHLSHLLTHPIKHTVFTGSWPNDFSDMYVQICEVDGKRNDRDCRSYLRSFHSCRMPWEPASMQTTHREAINYLVLCCKSLSTHGLASPTVRYWIKNAAIYSPSTPVAHTITNTCMCTLRGCCTAKTAANTTVTGLSPHMLESLKASSI